VMVVNHLLPGAGISNERKIVGRLDVGCLEVDAVQTAHYTVVGITHLCRNECEGVCL
jgi:hypothetical protein